jgi:hypothetical protein
MGRWRAGGNDFSPLKMGLKKIQDGRGGDLTLLYILFSSFWLPALIY